MEQPAGLYVRFGSVLDLGRNQRLHRLHRALMSRLPGGVNDVLPAYTTLYIDFDATRISGAAVRAWVQAGLRALDRSEDDPGEPPRTHRLPVRYDGPDLPDVAARTGLDVDAVIRLHAKPTYHVFAVGFTPGFPFLGVLPEPLQLPRRDAPRAQVPPASVAIAAAQSCVYPLPSPGGWHLLGTALQNVYDPNRERPVLLAPGDTVQFVPASGAAAHVPGVRELWPAAPRHPALRVEEGGLSDLLLDGGRFRQGHLGLARSGPLDARAAAHANSLVGNPPGTPLLELTLRGPVLTALRDVVLGVAGFGMRVQGHPAHQSFLLRAGETLRFTPGREGARAYLGVAGGLETCPFLGSSSTDLLGRVGRPLRAGDVLGLARLARPRPGFAGLPLALPGAATLQPVILRLLPGPQATLEALRALDTTFKVDVQDRMGIRLNGPAVPGGSVISEATPAGAVQVTPAGVPILLLADRGRLGGYTKPAVLHPHDLPLAAQVRPGQTVRLRPDLNGTPAQWAHHWTMDTA